MIHIRKRWPICSILSVVTRKRFSHIWPAESWDGTLICNYRIYSIGCLRNISLRSSPSLALQYSLSLLSFNHINGWRPFLCFPILRTWRVNLRELYPILTFRSRPSQQIQCKLSLTQLVFWLHCQLAFGQIESDFMFSPFGVGTYRWLDFTQLLKDFLKK